MGDFVSIYEVGPRDGLQNEKQIAYSDEAGRVFRREAGQAFQFDAGHRSDLKPDAARCLWVWLMIAVEAAVGQATVVSDMDTARCLRRLSPDNSMR